MGTVAGTEESGEIQNSLASSQFFRMLGVDAQDLGESTLHSYVMTTATSTLHIST